MSTDRRAHIAAGAIDLIATNGIRALTHRAVDTWLGLPPGSTSYYFRTRHALIEAVADAITTRSRTDFATAQATRSRNDTAFTPATRPHGNTTIARNTYPADDSTIARNTHPHSNTTVGRSPDPSANLASLAPGQPLVPTEIAHGIAGWLDHLLASRRNELIARHALIIEVRGDPELQARLAGSLFSHARTTDLFTALGSPDPESAAADFLALLEGLVFDRLTGLRATTPTGTPDSVTALARPLTTFLDS